MDQKIVNFKVSLYEELTKLGKCLANAKRLELMDLLTQGPKTVEALANCTGMSIANTSRNLQILNEGRLVKKEKNKNYVIYSIATNQIVDLFYQFRDVGEQQLGEIRRLQTDFDENQGVYTLSLKEAYQRVKSGDVVLLDVRPQDEYQAGHIDHAQNIPFDELADRLSEIPDQQDIIVYCRGHLCAYTNLATNYLHEQNRRAYSLHESYYDWQKFTTRL